MKNSKMNKVIIKSGYSRKYPDPLNQSLTGDPYNIEHHTLLCRATDVPSNIPKDPNPREQRIDYSIYKKVKESLEDSEDLSFHLKNKGITILAHKVEYSSDKKVATVYFSNGDGIADGGHTYEIILSSLSSGTCPDGQYVKFEVLTGVPRDMIVDITGGLNTAVQVQDASLANLEGKFEWVKETLKDMPYASSITYKQNEKGEYDIRDILSFLTLFNINKFSNSKHPKDAYVSKAKCLNLFNEDPNSFKMLQPILKDILYLRDYIDLKGRQLYNSAKGGSAGAMKGLYASRKRGKYKFIFINEEEQFKMYDGALYPILGAMRFLVEQKNGNNVYSWKIGSLEKVKSFFDEIAPDLIATTYNTSITHGRKPNAIGKDDNHWDNLYKTVALHYLTKYVK